MGNLRYLQTLIFLMSTLLFSDAFAGSNGGTLSLGGANVSSTNQWGFGSPKYDHATGTYSTPGIVWNGKGPAPNDGGAGAKALLSGSILQGKNLIQRADGSYVISSKTQSGKIPTASIAPKAYIAPKTNVAPKVSAIPKASVTSKVSVQQSTTKNSVPTESATPVARTQTLGGPNVSSGNRWGFGSPKYDHATGKYSTPGIVWNGPGPAPDDGGAGVRELLSGSILEGAPIVKRADGSYVVNTRAVTSKTPKTYIAPKASSAPLVNVSKPATDNKEPLQAASVTPTPQTLGGPNVSAGNRWGFGSPKYDRATGKYSSPGIVWNGPGPAPDDGGAGVRELLSGSILEGATLTRRADGSYVVNSRGIARKTPQLNIAPQPQVNPATAILRSISSSPANQQASKINADVQQDIAPQKMVAPKTSVQNSIPNFAKRLEALRAADKLRVKPKMEQAKTTEFSEASLAPPVKIITKTPSRKRVKYTKAQRKYKRHLRRLARKNKDKKRSVNSKDQTQSK